MGSKKISQPQGNPKIPNGRHGKGQDVMKSADSYWGINGPVIKMLCFVILFSCGASGYVQTTLLRMYSYMCNKLEGQESIACQNDCGQLFSQL